MVERVSSAQRSALQAASAGRLVFEHGYLGCATIGHRVVQSSTMACLLARGWATVPDGEPGQTVVVRLTTRGVVLLRDLAKRRTRRTPPGCSRCRRFVAGALATCSRCGSL